MSAFEYKVVAAPNKAKSFKGVRSHEDQFAEVLCEVMNDMARKDWEYLRAESLPCEEKTGLTSRVQSFQSVLVFRRAIAAKQKFFETLPTHQLELHQVPEDGSEQDITFASGRRASAAVAPTDTQETQHRRQSGVLSILQTRKARLSLDDSDSYPEHMKLAGE